MHQIGIGSRFGGRRLRVVGQGQTDAAIPVGALQHLRDPGRSAGAADADHQSVFTAQAGEIRNPSRINGSGIGELAAEASGKFPEGGDRGLGRYIRVTAAGD